MTKIFYLFGLFQVIYELYYFLRNIKYNSNPIDVIDLNLNVGQLKFSGKDKEIFKASNWQGILYSFLHVSWMVGGLWMDEKFLFMFLLAFDFGSILLPAFKVITLSSKAMKINQFIIILITASICYLHYFAG